LRKLERVKTPRNEPLCGDCGVFAVQQALKKQFDSDMRKYSLSALRKVAKLLLNQSETTDDKKARVIEWFEGSTTSSWYETICEDMMADHYNPQSVEKLLNEIEHTEAMARKRGRYTSVFLSGNLLWGVYCYVSLSLCNRNEVMERITQQLRVCPYGEFKAEHGNRKLQEETWYIVHRNEHFVLAWYANKTSRRGSALPQQGDAQQRKRACRIPLFPGQVAVQAPDTDTVALATAGTRVGSASSPICL
jgi:hypothetical protein